MGEIDSLIHFWEQHLFHNRSFMAIGLIWQLEQTIKFLKQMKELEDLKRCSQKDS